MPVHELSLPALVRHQERTPDLHILICEICGTKAEFNPQEAGEFEDARYQLARHRCKGQ